MAKSGSTLLQKYCSDLLSLSCPRNGQEVFRNAVSSGKLSGVAEFMDCPNEQTLPILEEIVNGCGPIVVKIHADVNAFLLQALRDKRLVMVTTYRDPRDMLLSAIDHANRVRGKSNAAFQEFTTVIESIPHAKWWANMAIHWMDSGLSLPVRYTDLLDSPESVIEKVALHWGIPINREHTVAAINREKELRRCGINQFNKGQKERWKHELNPKDRAALTSGLRDEIKSLGFLTPQDEERDNHLKHWTNRLTAFFSSRKP